MIHLARVRLSSVGLAIVLAAAPPLVAQVPELAAERGASASPDGAEISRSELDAVNGRIESHAHGFRVLRVWGSPRERGFAHGRLMAREITTAIRAEFRYRFEGQEHLLEVGRASLPRLISYPEAVAAEIEGVFDGMRASGEDLRIEGLERDIDLVDMLFLNALDVFALMGCSGFTAVGEQVEGGGVLSTRNFDWPYSGPHMTDGTIVLVQEPEQGRAFAAVTLPGYVGVVTGVSEDGTAVYLHVGSGKRGMPEPDSMPTATAARQILQFAPAEGRLDYARSQLEYTSPPSSYLVRVVSSTAQDLASAAAVFETETSSVQLRQRPGPCVVTNHFLADEGSRDSSGRFLEITNCVQACLATQDHKISVGEAWDAMQAVERGGKRFASLHSLVFRHEPWVFELRVATAEGKDGRVIGAPSSARQFAPSRQQLFRGRSDSRASTTSRPGSRQHER